MEKLAKKAGVFWGSFDPPTLAHKAIIDKMAQLFTNCLIVVKNNPQQQYFAAIEHRVMMVDNLLAKNNKQQYTIVVQDKQHSNNYFDLQAKLLSKLYVVVGMDALQLWLQQHDVADLLQYDGIYVVPRNVGNVIDISKKNNIKLLSIEEKYKNNSSTKVRALLQQQLFDNAEKLLDQKILTYIKNAKLYLDVALLLEGGAVGASAPNT